MHDTIPMYKLTVGKVRDATHVLLGLLWDAPWFRRALWLAVFYSPVSMLNVLAWFGCHLPEAACFPAMILLHRVSIGASASELRMSLTPSASNSFQRGHLRKSGHSLRGKSLEAPEGFRLGAGLLCV